MINLGTRRCNHVDDVPAHELANTAHSVVPSGLWCHRKDYIDGFTKVFETPEAVFAAPRSCLPRAVFVLLRLRCVTNLHLCCDFARGSRPNRSPLPSPHSASIMGCTNSTSAGPSDAKRPYTPEKPKPAPQTKEVARAALQKDSSDSLKSFSDSALNVKLSTDKNLVLVWDGEAPSKNAYYEQAAMVLKIKGIEFTEEIVAPSNPPTWYKVRQPRPTATWLFLTLRAFADAAGCCAPILDLARP